MPGNEGAHLVNLSKDIEALKTDSSEVKDGLKKIYDVLSRLAVLEDNREHTEDSISRLFSLYHKLKDKLTCIEASIAVIKTGVSNNNQVSGWIIYAGVAVASSVITLLAASQIFKP